MRIKIQLESTFNQVFQETQLDIQSRISESDLASALNHICEGMKMILSKSSQTQETVYNCFYVNLIAMDLCIGNEHHCSSTRHQIRLNDNFAESVKNACAEINDSLNKFVEWETTELERRLKQLRS